MAPRAKIVEDNYPAYFALSLIGGTRPRTRYRYATLKIPRADQNDFLPMRGGFFLLLR